METRNLHLSRCDVELAIDKILYLQYKGILIGAYREYEKLLDLVKNSDDRDIHELMEQNQQIFHELTVRYHEIDQTIVECTSSHDQWTLGSDRFGVPTYYRVDDDGLLCVRLEGTQETPIFEQMAVLYEVALHSEWVPFCDRSNILKKMCTLF